MKKIVINYGAFLGLILASTSAWAECECESSYCTLSCINNFGDYSDTTISAEIQGDQCSGNTGGMTLDELCKSKGFKGVAPHDKNYKDRPPLWCPDVYCR